MLPNVISKNRKNHENLINPENLSRNLSILINRKDVLVDYIINNNYNLFS